MSYMEPVFQPPSCLAAQDMGPVVSPEPELLLPASTFSHALRHLALTTSGYVIPIRGVGRRPVARQPRPRALHTCLLYFTHAAQLPAGRRKQPLGPGHVPQALGCWRSPENAADCRGGPSSGTGRAAHVTHVAHALRTAPWRFAGSRWS
jgi:hypothetical protein